MVWSQQNKNLFFGLTVVVVGQETVLWEDAKFLSSSNFSNNKHPFCRTDSRIVYMYIYYVEFG